MDKYFLTLEQLERNRERRQVIAEKEEKSSLEPDEDTDEQEKRLIF